jgi:hypothetical protein
MKEQKKHLYYLDELSDYKVDNHYPDVTGWSVKDRDNRVIGKVDKLLVNKNLMKVVYLDVEVDKTIIDAEYDPYSNSQNLEVREFVNKEGENHVIIPVGMVHIHEDQKYVHTESINYQTFAETKRFSSGANLDREYEVNVLESYRRTSNHQDNQLIDADHHKESPYRSDREETRENKLISGSDISEERRKLEDERHKLKKERLKLEEERRKLERERNRQDHNRDTVSNPTLNETEREQTYSNSERYADDDSFYERGEFDGTNYRNSDLGISN